MFRVPLDHLKEWSSATSTSYAIVGGIAVGVRARPRATKDIDLIVYPGDNMARLLAGLSDHGFEARVPDAIAVAEVTRVLLLKHSQSGTPIDVMLGLLPYEEQMVAEAPMARLAGVAIPVISAESLCVMKMLAQRPRDLADLVAILFANPALDRARVEADMAGLAQLLEDPTLLSFAQEFLRTHPPADTAARPHEVDDQTTM